MRWQNLERLPGLPGNKMFQNVYANKKVLITGHTGFKGSWLCQWLLKLGAQVVGFSKGHSNNTQPIYCSEFRKKISHKIGDVRDFDSLEKLVALERPDFIFI